MDSKRIKEIQDQTIYPDSFSVSRALHKVWNEMAQERLEVTPRALAQSIHDLMFEMGHAEVAWSDVPEDVVEATVDLVARGIEGLRWK